VSKLEKLAEAIRKILKKGSLPPDELQILIWGYAQAHLLELVKSFPEISIGDLMKLTIEEAKEFDG